ncbi:MAG: copper transporter [bacterium]
MIFNFRYHIFTITAIFAALGLGILIGTSIIGDETLIREQKKIIDNIGGDIKNIKKENVSLKNDIDSLREEIEYREEMEREILSLFIKDKKEVLKNKEYILLTEQENKIKEIQDIFQMADIKIDIKNNLDFLDKDNPVNEKMILWQVDSENYGELKNNDNIKEEILYCNEKDLIGFIHSFVESEIMNE